MSEEKVNLNEPISNQRKQEIYEDAFAFTKDFLGQMVKRAGDYKKPSEQWFFIAETSSEFFKSIKDISKIFQGKDPKKDIQ